MIRSSEYFSYNGQTSDTFGILNVNIASSGMMEEPFMASREILTTEIRGRVEPYFQEVRLEPLSFSLELGYDGTFTEEDLREIRKWLSQPYYKELYFSEELDQRYYAILNSDITINHTGIGGGYLKCEFLCNSAYKFSPVITKEFYITTLGTSIEIFNNGDNICYPKIIIIPDTSDDAFSIINTTDGGNNFAFSSIANEEIVTIWNKEKIITSSTSGTYRYSDFNQNWLKLTVGKNVLLVANTGYIKIEYEESYL